jgi:hypothetical protein
VRRRRCQCRSILTVPATRPIVAPWATAPTTSIRTGRTRYPGDRGPRNFVIRYGRTVAFRSGGNRRRLRRTIRCFARRRIGAAHGRDRSRCQRKLPVQLALGRRNFSRLLPRREAEPGRVARRNQPADQRGDGSGIGGGDCRQCGGHGSTGSRARVQPSPRAAQSAGTASRWRRRAGRWPARIGKGAARISCSANWAGGSSSDRVGSFLAPGRRRYTWKAAGASASSLARTATS